jgi:phage shock protein E
MSFSAIAADVRYNGVKPDFIIDVRTAEEYSMGHIDGAINVPVDQIAQQIAGIKGLKPGSTLLVYCRSGRRSAAAAQILQQRGYQHVFDGGAVETLAKSLKKCTSSAC